MEIVYKHRHEYGVYLTIVIIMVLCVNPILIAGYDCGVYAMCFAEAVCAVKLRKEEERATIDAMSPKKAQEWRANTQARIQSMALEWRRAQN